MRPASDLFRLHRARSGAYANYDHGEVPFISNGLSGNGMIGYVKPKPGDSVFQFTGICVSAFAEATVQKPPFIARGNGGSGLIVLEPIGPISIRDLLWYAAYINEAIRWRFSFGRMVTVERFQSLPFPEPADASIPDAEGIIPQVVALFRPK